MSRLGELAERLQGAAKAAAGAAEFDPEQVAKEYQEFTEFLTESPQIQKVRERARARMSPTPRELVYTENSTALYRYRRDTPPTVATPLLVVPSTVNKPCLMDLIEGESFVAAMLERGFDVWMLEWGEPNPGQKDLSLGHYLRTYLGRAVRRVCRRTGAKKVNLAGICLGGLFALLYAALDKGLRVQNLVTMVTPVNFDDHGLLSWWSRKEHLNVDKVVESFGGNVPAEFFSASFPWLVPTGNLKKVKTVYERHKDDEFMERFMALDIWITENIAFPGAVYRELIQTGYQENTLVRNGEWVLDGEPARLADVTMPVLNMVATYDHVSPAASCAALSELVGSDDCTSEAHPTSHLGFALGKDITGKHTTAYWDRMAGWMAERDG